MMWIDYYAGSPVAETLHEVVIDGTHVMCDYLWCTYDEEFDTVKDAEAAAEIHEEANS